MPEYALHLLFIVGLYVALVASLDIVTGYLGITSACHAALYGVGAYVAGFAATRFAVSAPVVSVTAIVGGALVGAILSWIIRPLRNEAAVLGTLAIQLIISSTLTNVEALGGARGIAGIGSTTPAPVHFALATVGLATVAMGLRNVVGRSALGLRLRSIRDDPVAAAACGVDARRDVAAAFAIAASIAAAAGATRAFYVSYIDPGAFGLDESVALLTMLLIAGVERPWAPVIGVAIVTAAQEGVRFIGAPASYAANLRQVVFGTILVIAVVLQRSSIRPREVVR